jgi:demethylmenaquinone methyltransferase/2-methoxy-6-polyprenyl-1,4-benzoquinol methylase
MVAPFFDAVLGPFMTAVQQEIRRTMGRLAVRDVLDICCGTGRQVRLLAESGMRGVGIDRSPSMLDMAGSRSRGLIPFLLGDARNLPFRDNSFDGALLSFALHENEPHMWRPMVREATRILRPHGRLLILDYLAPGNLARPGAVGPLLIHAVEWMAGERHYRNFRKFVSRGGLEGVLQEHPVRITDKSLHFFGMVGLVSCVKERSMG